MCAQGNDQERGNKHRETEPRHALRDGTDDNHAKHEKNKGKVHSSEPIAYWAEVIPRSTGGGVPGDPALAPPTAAGTAAETQKRGFRKEGFLRKPRAARGLGTQ
ncbi:hypothetical protein GCM10017711_36370 [Paeniglutamicibacter sulfureus]